MSNLRFLLPLFAVSMLSAQVATPSADQQLAHDIYKEFVEINSGFTTGATTPVAEAAARRLRAAGFPDSDLFLGGASPNKFNLVARYRGTGAQKPLLLLAHIDVVEAKREDWSVDPFTLLEKDGYFYGRGTLDDKAQAAIWIESLIRMKRQNIVPDRDIIVALTADEEGGGPFNGVDWLLSHHRDLIDAGFALNEGAYGEMSQGRMISNDIEMSEKYIITYTFQVHNKGGHSSLPVKDNAIYHLAHALDNLSAFEFPLQTDDVTRAYFAQMAKLETGPLHDDLLAAAKGSKDAMKRVADARPLWNANLRTTCVATLLAGGHAFNALPQLATATVNCRALPQDSIQSVTDALTSVVNDPQVVITKISDDVSAPPSPLRKDVMDAITRANAEVFPGVPVLPILVTGATDGRRLRAVGIPTYGAWGLFVDRDDVRAHGRDERLAIDSFYKGQAFLYRLITLLTVRGVAGRE